MSRKKQKFVVVDRGNVVGKRQKRPGSGNNRARDQDDDVFKALANADRRALLDQLRELPRTTGELCASMPHLDRSTVMLHLKVLGDAELILTKKKGRFRWNYLNVEPIQRVYNRWIKDYAQGAAELLTRLKAQIEDSGDD